MYHEVRISEGIVERFGRSHKIGLEIWFNFHVISNISISKGRKTFLGLISLNHRQIIFNKDINYRFSK